ncbi:MAG: sigma-70 family RNA polymerase sigma factor [Planctomycetales bacterium]|nr:sigma-70 family RNA polymerase sigma factor [Planctomycetales bacterium]
MKQSNHQSDPASEVAEPDGQSDEAWLAEVFRENELPLMGYATYLLGDRDRAGDVVQDAFVRLCKQPKEEVRERVRQWLFRVCRNRALDIMKKESRMKTLDDAKASRQISRDSDPSSIAEMAERHENAQSLLAELPGRQQEVIRLKVHGGLSYQEISELTGLSVGNVGYLLSTGLKLVRSRLTTAE